MARWVNLDDCVEISAGEMNFYPVELLGDIYEDVAPVVHAKWIHEGWSKYRCSNCGGVFEYDTEFCGDCGARMDEEVL